MKSEIEFNIVLETEITNTGYYTVIPIPTKIVRMNKISKGKPVRVYIQFLD